jgi:cysteine desulfuration protein SufE
MEKEIKSISSIQNEIREAFVALPSSDEKWSYLLKIAKSHPQMDVSLKDEKFLVQGCATRLFLVPSFQEGRLYLTLDTDGGSDSPLIVRGLAALASQVYNGQKPKDILATDPGFFQEIGLTVALSATRANGFASLLKQIYLYAQVFGRMS